MRRPLNWIVVSISLMVLFANRLWAPRPVEQFVGKAPEIVPVASIAAPASPFAYVREDGTQEYLPLPPPSFEQLHAEDGFDRWVDTQDTDPKAAVYTWSSPVIAAEPQPLKF